LSNLAQIASQIEPPTSNGPPANGSRPQVARAAVRPEAAGGLDGWLMDRLFGR
jgi:penicillin-binding protein 1A